MPPPPPPNYLICSTDKDDYAHILINLCPYFFEQQAKITVQAINALANIEILGKDDYIIFEQWVGINEYARFGQPITVDAKTRRWLPSGAGDGRWLHIPRVDPIPWHWEVDWVIVQGPLPGVPDTYREIKLVRPSGWRIDYKIEGIPDADKETWWTRFTKFAAWDDPGIYRTSWYANGKKGSHRKHYTVPNDLPPGTMFKPYHMWPVEWQYTDGWRIFTEDEEHPEHTRMASVAQIPEGWLIQFWVMDDVEA
jgi:hypothetical protein